MIAPGTMPPRGKAAYQFRPMTVHDLVMVNAWLAKPHVRQWWDDEELTLAAADEPPLDQYIVAIEGHPIAYLQCYLHSACPENELGTHPPGTRGIDQFIGSASMLGRGHGSAFIRAFVDGLMTTGVPRVITDPNSGNGRAIRAYTKAGFRSNGEVDTPDGRALLMIRDAG
jgi:aminoglycoside 6'-N-acetyltransferase